MKITIAIPTNREIKPKMMESLLKVVTYSQHDYHILLADRGYTVAENRNYAVIQAMRNKSDYLLFVDDDMVFPENTLERLLTNKKEIVGVATNKKVLPKQSTIGLFDENGEYKDPERHPDWEMKLPDELFKAFFVGGGVLLIDMKVFEKIEKPYFEFITNEDGMVTDGEDGMFCKKAQKAGFDTWCDPTLTIGHIGNYIY